MARIKTIFDPIAQREVFHELSVDRNGEIVAQSQVSNHMVKIPAGMSAEEINQWIAQYKEANQGQVKAEAAEIQNAESQSVLDAIAEGTVSDENPA